VIGTIFVSEPVYNVFATVFGFVIILAGLRAVMRWLRNL
jgi:hypothetical protein